MEKYLTAAQRKEQERKEKEEEERRIREQGDNARERGLDMMMGGVLEIKKEDELKKVSPFYCLSLRSLLFFFSFFFAVFHSSGMHDLMFYASENKYMYSRRSAMQLYKMLYFSDFSVKHE